MLYDRWRQIAQQHRNEIALRDVASGQQWTFSQLAALAESSSTTAPVVFPQGLSSEFIFAVLRAWRSQSIVCPLEVGQTPPAIETLPGIAHLKMTSATTGPARLIALKAEQLAADSDNIVATMGLRPEWPNIGVISLAHSYGFSNLVLPLLLNGISLVLAPAPFPAIVAKTIEQVGDVTLPSVPALWRAWFEARVISPRVRLAISAGAPLPISLEQSVFAECGTKIHNFYGSSECGGIAYDTTDTPRTDGACAGTAMRNVQLSIADNGCLIVQSLAVAETYWPEANDNLGNGSFRTSDLAEIIDEKIYLRGRASDQINVAGRKISPETIERLLLTHPAVADCLVFGAPSSEAERAEKIVACVVSRNGSDSEVLRQFLLSQLPAWQVPRDWWFLDSLQTNQRGKLSRAAWREKFLSKSI